MSGVRVQRPQRKRVRDVQPPPARRQLFPADVDFPLSPGRSRRQACPDSGTAADQVLRPELALGKYSRHCHSSRQQIKREREENDIPDVAEEGLWPIPASPGAPGSSGFSMCFQRSWSMKEAATGSGCSVPPDSWAPTLNPHASTVSTPAEEHDDASCRRELQ